MARGTITGSDLTGRWPANVIFDEEAAQLLGEAARFFYCAKASSRERNEGLDGLSNDAAFYGVGMRGHSPDPYYVRVHSPDPSVISGYLRSWRERSALSKTKMDELLGTVTLYSWYEGRPAGTELPTPEMWKRLKGILGFDETHDKEMLEVVLKEKGGFNNSQPRKNNHPTVKPLKLMEYLLKLIAPPKDALILDPFAGSGTTILAAQRLGIQAVGIEKSEEYCAIARARLATR